MKANSCLVTVQPLEEKSYAFKALSKGVFKLKSSHYPHARIVVGDLLKLFVDITLNRVELITADCWEDYEFIKTNEKIEITLKFE